MRQATESDLYLLTDCYVKIARHMMKAGEQDFYIARLPETPQETIRNHLARYLGREDALSCWRTSKVRLSLACWPVSAASFSASRVGKSGHIAVCWVEPANRRSGIAAKLVRAAENWFWQKEVGIVELSYLVKNELAAVSWQRLGYQPFRVFAYKEL